MQDFFADVTDGSAAADAVRRATGQLAAAARRRGRWPVSEVRVLGELAVLDDVGPPRRGRAYPAAGATSALLLPASLLLGGLVVWPVLRTLHASVTTRRSVGRLGQLPDRPGRAGRRLRRSAGP